MENLRKAKTCLLDAIETVHELKRNAQTTDLNIKYLDVEDDLLKSLKKINITLDELEQIKTLLK